ncbi:uncharacterized protein [Montipora foliosa]|uniref:uncharacterized protein n=1 Tax=Montipora foliosa TaxID=591990 RepID=UPI0035F1467D
MLNASNPHACPQHIPCLDPEAIVTELMENAARQGSSLLPIDRQFLEDLTGGENPVFPCERESSQGYGCYTPPDSVQSATPSPSGIQSEATVSDQSGNDINFDCPNIVIVSKPGQSNSTRLGIPSNHTTTPMQTAVPQPRVSPGCVNTGFQGNGILEVDASLASPRSQVTSAECSRACIEILNPKEEYDKVQKKRGPKGKVSEQRIKNGQVEMRIKTYLPLSELCVYVQREPQAEKKLTEKDPRSYGVGPTRFDELTINPVASVNPALEPPTYLVKLDLDSLYKTSNNKEVYKLEKNKGTEYNRFWLRIYLKFVDGTHVVHFPYEFILKSEKTIKALSSRSSVSPGRVPTAELSPHGASDMHHTRLMCQYLDAEFARIKTLQVEQIKTTNHDIAYFIKRKDPEGSPFDEGDVVGFFENAQGETVIDLLTSENARRARLAGVISRSAYLKAHTGRCDSESNDADLVCVIGEIQVKVVGKVRTGELIYTCPSDKFPGTATAKHHRGALRQTLLGYAMGEASGFGVSKVDCIVSLVLSVNAEERLREMAQVFGSINEVRESMEVHIDNVGHRISKMQRGWTGIWKKLLGILVFLSVVSLVCGLMLPPNSPFMKAKCQAGSIKGHQLKFTYYPPQSDESFVVIGLEFTWDKLKQKLDLEFGEMNGTGNRYFLNKVRCETGAIRAIASWLDPSPTLLPPVSVLAVDKNRSAVWYHSKQKWQWLSYGDDAKDISCVP